MGKKLGAKPPKAARFNFKEWILTFVLTIIHLLAVFFLIISAREIIMDYTLLISGNLLNGIQKMTMDYSITIFAGCAIYLLTYALQLENMIKKVFTKEAYK